MRESQNFEIWSRDLRHAHLGGRFVVRTQYGSVICVCAKFEADITIRSKVIRGSQNFEIGHVTQATPTLWFIRSRGPTSMSVPNLKHIAQFVQKL